MIADWLGKPGQKALDIIGWPEWIARGLKNRLDLNRGTSSGCDWRVRNNATCGDSISDHEALCLLREHARSWLAERGYVIVPINTENLDGVWGLYDGKGTEILYEEDYDKAVIVAVIDLDEYAKA